MNIVHAILSFNTGGAETMLVDILNEQVKSHRVTLVIINESYEPRLLEQVDGRVVRHFLHRCPGSRSPWPLLRLNLLVRRLHPDALHLHHSSLFRMLFPGVCSRLFLTVHALGVDLQSVRRATCLFAISQVVAEDIRRRSSCAVAVIPNGIVVDRIRRKSHYAPLEGRRMRVVNVARLESDDKGQDLLIRALGELRRQGEDLAEADFIGTGRDAEKLAALAREEGVEDRIRLLGLRDRPYIYAHLADYDVMCHPSRHEGFGLTVAEGMAAGLPILAASGDGPAELIEQGRLGLLFENGSADSCACQLAALYRHYDRQVALTDEAAEKVKRQYSVSRMAADYVAAYEKR